MPILSKGSSRAHHRRKELQCEPGYSSGFVTRIVSIRPHRGLSPEVITIDEGAATSAEKTTREVPDKETPAHSVVQSEDAPGIALPPTIPPPPPVPPLSAVPFTFAPLIRDPFAAVPPPPVIRIEEDEDAVVSRLFPQTIPARPAGRLPATPTIALDRDGQPQPESALAANAGVPMRTRPPLVEDYDGHLHEHEFSESELAVRPDEADSSPRSEKRNVLSALLVIGHLLLLNGLSIPVTAYIIHRFGELRYGFWAAATELVTLTGLMSTLGLRPLFVRAIAQRPELAEEELSFQLGLRALLTMGAAGLALCLVWSLHYFKPGDYTNVVVTCVVIAVGSMVLNVMAQTLADLLQGLHRMKAYSAINFISGLSLTGASLYVAWNDPDPVALSFAYMAGPAVGLVCFWMAARRHFRIRVRFSYHKFRELLRESRTIGAYQISVVIRDRLERILLPALTGMRKFGFYAAGIMPADRLFVVPEGFITAFFPAISRSHYEDSQSNGNSASRHVLHLMVTSLVACTPLAILITFLADPIARIFFPKDPALCRDVIQVTIWAIPLRGLQLPMGCALQASGRHAIAAKTGIAATFVSLGLTVVLISLMGIRGATWAWVGRAAISTLFLIPAFVRAFPGVYTRVPIFRIVAGLLLMGGLLWGSLQVGNPLGGPVGTWIMLGAGACAAVMVYVVAMILLRVIEISDLKGMLRRRTAE
jgi:O-antigen/teichoic acid export membrane protein